MSWEALTWAVQRKAGSPAAKLLLLLLANRTNTDTEVCYPSIDRLAEDSELNRSTVIRNLKALETRGILRVERRLDQYGRNEANVYRLLMNVKVGARVAPRHPDSGTVRPMEGGVVPPESELFNQNKNQKKREAGAVAPFSLPDWLPLNEWEEFRAHRKRKRAPMTEAIERRIVGVLDKLRVLGHDPAKVLTEAIDRNWTAIKVDWIHKEAKRPAEPKGFAGLREVLRSENQNKH